MNYVKSSLVGRKTKREIRATKKVKASLLPTFDSHTRAYPANLSCSPGKSAIELIQKLHQA